MQSTKKQGFGNLAEKNSFTGSLVAGRKKSRKQKPKLSGAVLVMRERQRDRCLQGETSAEILVGTEARNCWGGGKSARVGS